MARDDVVSLVSAERPRNLENGVSRRTFGGGNDAERTAIIDAPEARDCLACQHLVSIRLEADPALLRDDPAKEEKFEFGVLGAG